jgi:hypothetical protein
MYAVMQQLNTTYGKKEGRPFRKAKGEKEEPPEPG